MADDAAVFFPLVINCESAADGLLIVPGALSLTSYRGGGHTFCFGHLFELHITDGAAARLILSDFGMHRDKCTCLPNQ